MKYLKTLFIALVAIAAISSCVSSKETAQTPAPPKDSIGVVKNANNQLIPFREFYRTTRNTTVQFSPANMMGIYYRTSVDLKVVSSLFTDNINIVDGNAYVLNSELDKLSTIPAGSIFRLTGSTANDIVTDSYGTKHLKLVLSIPEKGIKYTFWWTRISDLSFVNSLPTHGWVEYNGKKSDALTSGTATAMFNLFEGGTAPSSTITNQTGAAATVGSTLPPPGN